MTAYPDISFDSDKFGMLNAHHKHNCLISWLGFAGLVQAHDWKS